MTSIYRYTSILTWNDINTYLMFYGTTLTLGAVLFVLVVMVIRKAGHRAGLHCLQMHCPYHSCGCCGE